jgi:hypothetical protein
MSQRTESAAPPGWQVVVEVDSRLEADLAVRMLSVNGIEALAVELGSARHGVFVAENDREAAGTVLDVR